MSNVSLTANILTRKVETGNANKIQSHRIQDPNAQMCPVWNGQDLAGRPVCEYSFYTKRAGCNSALDRITVENFLRPTYANYITISAAGISGYQGKGSNEKYTPGDNLQRDEAVRTAQSIMKSQSGTGKFGVISAEQLKPSNPEEELAASNGVLSADTMARVAQRGRVNQNTSIGYASQKRFDYGQNAPQYLVNPVTYSVNPNYSYEALAPRGLSYVKEQSFRGCGDKRVC